MSDFVKNEEKNRTATRAAAPVASAACRVFHASRSLRKPQAARAAIAMAANESTTVSLVATANPANVPNPAAYHAAILGDA